MNDISCLDSRNVGNATHILTVLPPPPPAKNRSASLSITSKQNSIVETEVSPSHQPPSQPTSLILPPPVTSNDSPCSSPTDTASSPRSSLLSASDQKSWSFFHKDGNLGWTNFEEHRHLLGNEEENSERHSSDDDFDYWSVTDEQKEYYMNQFKSMQPDMKKKITGATAKEFFEKSKLPVAELSKIWQLSDVDKDGALCFEEFCTAMHLVVLRRNNIELPEALPPSLVPKMPKKVSEPDVNIIPNHAQPVPQNHGVNSPKQPSPSELVSPQSKEWTKFNDSPTSSLSSPGMKPVNFDFSAASVEQDPKILHPVALRLSPERQAVYNSSSEKDQTVNSLTAHPQESNCEPANVRIHSSSFSGTSESCKASSVSIPQGPKKEPPPPPPPRPKHNHTRSSSLDLNRLGKTVPHFLGAPPAVPPRISPSSSTPQKNAAYSDDPHNLSESIDFADFTNFDDPETANLHLKSGAFEVYKKPLSAHDRLTANSSAGSETCLLDQVPTPAAIDDSTVLLVDLSNQDETDRTCHPAAPPLALAAKNIIDIPKDRRELESAIKAHRDRNQMLLLVNNELNQELSEIMEERIALEIQLDHLKPFS